MFEHGVWGNLNLFSWTMATYICFRINCLFFPSRRQLCFCLNTDTIWAPTVYLAQSQAVPYFISVSVIK